MNARTYSNAYRSRRAALWGGMRDYAGGSAQAMAAAFVGFGAIINDMGLSVWQGMAASGVMALMPAQMAMVDLFQTGAGLTAILLAVAFISARLLPMSMSVMPLMRTTKGQRIALYIAAFPLASTSWAYATRRCPDMPEDQRLPYFLAFALSNIAIIVGATALGYGLADRLPAPLTAGLVFVTPVFFVLLFIAESAHRAGLFALALGAAVGPPAYLLTPEWSVLLTGLVAGSAGMAIGHTRNRSNG